MESTTAVTIASEIVSTITTATTRICDYGFDDFRDWFNELAVETNVGGMRDPKLPASRIQSVRAVEFKAFETDSQLEPSSFAKLLLKCARKAIHLSVPIQTFVPVSL